MWSQMSTCLRKIMNLPSEDEILTQDRGPPPVEWLDGGRGDMLGGVDACEYESGCRQIPKSQGRIMSLIGVEAAGTVEIVLSVYTKVCV